MLRAPRQQPLRVVTRALAFFVLVSTATAWGKVIYVNIAASGTVHDGMTWKTAYLSLNSSYFAISPGDEVWVASGTYPGHSVVANGASYLGGFAGTETAREQRAPRSNVTKVGYAGGGYEYSFVAGSSVTQTATIDGFTVSGGQGAYLPSGVYAGGGIRCEGADVVISGNVISGNDIDRRFDSTFGGGIYCHSGRVVIRNNTIMDNWAQNGAAIYSNGADVTIAGNVISLNHGSRTLTSRGCGVCIYPSDSNVVVRDNLISDNDGRDCIGAGILCSATTATITGNTIVGNVTTWPGAAMNVYTAATIANNIVAWNSDGIALNGNAATLDHNDIYGNVGPGYADTIDHTGVDGNINADPQFVSRTGGNYRLQASSPCIDSGNDTVVAAGTTDLDGNPRIFGPQVDIGAYECSGSATPYTVLEVLAAMKIAGGLANVPSTDMARLNVDPVSPQVNMADAIRIARKVAGLDSNP